MNTPREQASHIFKAGVNVAVNKANQTGFVAPAQFTFLADMIQIQCLFAEDTDRLNFLLPIGLYTTIQDLAAQNGAKFSAYKTKSDQCFALEFESEDEQDKFIQFFELISFKGARAYPTPDLFLGEPRVNKDLCQELLKFLHGVVQYQYDRGWSEIR